jgi:hypothetical protein
MDLLKFARHEGMFAAFIMITGFFKDSNEPIKLSKRLKS